MIHPIGRCAGKVFGLSPMARLERQWPADEALTLVTRADALFDDIAIHWLIDHPGTVLTSNDGRPLAVAVDPGLCDQAVAALDQGGWPSATPHQIGEHYLRKLRRRSEMLAMSLEEMRPAAAERLLFAKVYKGVTDLVTKYAWPEPALWVTRGAARLGISPNLITIVGISLTILAALLFFKGLIAAALVAAWTMTFLDTVDGKLARVTVTSSPIGNRLDHGNDVIHPPLWWLCVAHGLALNDPGAAPDIWLSCWLILGAYAVARGVEVSFHLLFGFNAFLFRRFDSRFRLVVARRNILLLVIAVGLLVDRPVPAFIACAAWSLVSTAIQLVRIGQAWLASRRAKLVPWIG